MNQPIELLPFCRIIKHNTRQRFAVNFTLGVADLSAECRQQIMICWLIFSDDVVTDVVRIKYDKAFACQEASNGAFSAGDSAGNSEHEGHDVQER